VNVCFLSVGNLFNLLLEDHHAFRSLRNQQHVNVNKESKKERRSTTTHRDIVMEKTVKEKG